MALSNIFREPRREITETVVGLVLAGPLVLADYKAAVWFQRFTGGQENGCPWQVGLIGVPAAIVLALIVVIVAAKVVHRVGDIICDELEEHGIRLRPRR